jgi:hypothetical protein
MPTFADLSDNVHAEKIIFLAHGAHTFAQHSKAEIFYNLHLGLPFSAEAR